MKKKEFFVLAIAVICISVTFKADNLFMAKGTIRFTSDAPLEVIKASSDKLVGALNIENKEFYFRVNMRTFNGFNSALQREHFNENYMESHKYPKTTFKGKIIEDIDFTIPGLYNIRAKGKMNIHGVENNRIIKCKLTVKKNLFKISSNFTVFLNEHNIKIPNIVNQKIAEEIMVKIEAGLKPKK